ncbi:hypothetical protein NEHOM01_1164 [Nematocida homosporus]|uniref:uncharacterized protein n=1 Tax=Nematocida homosporus TaxID=1912981 RepID=UPI00221FC220|nr:uncharacterized protein NEHOM01_1164 [Nematocida homosporus]KAI5185941.1 hypothetical protein NEHOM01_1164 [Nematocida homosporus]
MRFVIDPSSLAKVEILEFNGEFEIPEELSMRATKDPERVYFTSSYIEGTPQNKPKSLIFQRENDGLVLFGMADKHISFNKPPRYII